MDTALDELTAACARQAMPGDGERIAAGEPAWFAGYPLPAAPGTVALAQREGLKLVFRVEDIAEVHRWHERFVVRVRAGADMLVSMERVMKAGPSNCGCGGSEPNEPSGAVSRVAVQDGGPGDDWDVWIGNTFGTPCLWTIECFSVTLPFIGPVRICIPTHVLC